MNTSVSDVIARSIERERARDPDHVPLVGVAGAQGSGKTTACEALAGANPRFARFSIDDVYFNAAQRADFAARTHPLFVTRGPPGTHDIALARETIAALMAAGPDAETPLPRFDKIADKMKPCEDWPRFTGKPDAILIDAWCLGALPVGESAPLNAIEAQDADGVWRRTQDDFLRGSYGAWFAEFDAIVFLQAPNWEVVRRWRGQQEVTLRGRALTQAEEDWIDRFIMHYERITRSMLADAHLATCVVRLDDARNMLGAERRDAPNPPTSPS